MSGNLQNNNQPQNQYQLSKLTNMNKYKNTLVTLPSRVSQPVREQQIKKIPEMPNSINNANPIIVMASSKTKKFTCKHACLIYSRIQNKLHLKFATLFKAMALFKAYAQFRLPTKCQLPQQYALLICLNISMKYQQIYPPKLKKIMPFFKINSIDVGEYWKYEVCFIEMMGADFNLPTAKTIMDICLLNQEKVVHWHAYYLLQLSFMEERLTEYSLTEICLGIVGIMTKLVDTLRKKKTIEEGVDEERINYCSRVILKAKYKSIQNESAIYKKYCKQIYGNAAQKVIYIEDK